jgi:hypothetical protein
MKFLRSIEGKTRKDSTVIGLLDVILSMSSGKILLGWAAQSIELVPIPGDRLSLISCSI